MSHEYMLPDQKRIRHGAYMILWRRDYAPPEIGRSDNSPKDKFTARDYKLLQRASRQILARTRQNQAIRIFQTIDSYDIFYLYRSCSWLAAAFTRPACFIVELTTYSDNLRLNEYDKTMVTRSPKPYAVITKRPIAITEQ